MRLLVQEQEGKEEILSRLAAIVDSSEDAIFAATLEGAITSWNPAAERLFGYAAPEIIGRSVFVLSLPERRRETEDNLAQIRRGQRLPPVETVRRRKDGKPVAVSLAVSPIKDRAGNTAGVSVIARDISERKLAEQAVRESEERYRRLIEVCPDAMFTHKEDKIFYLNSACLRLLGAVEPAQVIGRSLFDFIHPDCQALARDRLARLVESGEPVPFVEHKLVRLDGSVVDVEIAAAPFTDRGGMAVQEVCRDLSERKTLDERLRQAQKMEAIGQLAGGVAHDFNNLLTIISGYSELLVGRVAPSDPTRGLLAEISKAGERAAGLTRQLLAFSRKQVLDPQTLDVNAIISDTEKMLGRLIGEDVSLVTALAPGLGQIKADAGQIQQVIMNLAVNARDAMPQGGQLTIETRNVHLDNSYAAMHPEVQPGRYVLLGVSDTGCGMDEKTRARLFEPFFTTKGPGKGTGLGLATVYGIVKQTGGHIWVYSEPDRGTTFKIYLPRIEDEFPLFKTIHHFRKSQLGTETILLVEDEGAVRALARHALENFGYTVLEASGGREALRLFDEYEKPIHLVVSDVVMPEMSGRQLVERLHSRKPDLKVLYISGYTDDAVVRHGILQAEVAFLQKPFTPTSLANKVREALDR